MAGVQHMDVVIHAGVQQRDLRGLAVVAVQVDVHCGLPRGGPAPDGAAQVRPELG